MSHRREVWGDDPEEREADATLAEFAHDEAVQRRWHEHPTVVPFKVVAAFIGRNGRRIAITVVGFLVVLIGLVLIPLPGPGWLIVFAGLAILAREYVWAERLLNHAKRRVGQAKDAVLHRKPKPEEPGPTSP
jgi:uncharacterized protein (TIGR02611 family)